MSPRMMSFRPLLGTLQEAFRVESDIGDLGNAFALHLCEKAGESHMK